MIYSVSVYYDQ